MPTLTQAPSQGDVVKFQFEPNYTNEAVTLLLGTNYKSGSVLGKITASSKYQLSASAAADGSQTPDLVLAEDVDASAADKPALAYARGDFNAGALTLGAGHTVTSITEGLRAKGIALLPAVSA